jgi:thioesterase domain-containing protein
MNCDNHSLRHLSVGGEKILPLTPPKGYQLHNVYGPTECTVFTTTYLQTEFEQNAPIGKPLDNLQLYIVDKDLNRLPLGAAGEMLVSGPQVSRGYLNLPEKTAQTYIQWNGKRCYRTGDVARFLADGNIQFVGRSDSQVKIRGFRIELGEVEAVIRDFEGIEDVTVQAFDAPDGGKFLAAYVVTDGSPLDIHALNAFIGSHKPPYMVPAMTMQIDSIPLTVNQKVDKKALPRPQVSAAKSEGNFVPLKGHLEETIAQCIAETLCIDPATISARDTFSMLGGNSIKAIKLNTLLKDQDIEIPMEHLLRQNDIRILALIADYASRGEYVEKCIALRPAQFRMLHQYLKHPDRPTDAYSVIMDIDSSVTEEILRRVIDTLVAKHTAITSAIAYVGTDQPMQVYLNGRQVPLYVIDAKDEQEAVVKMDDLRMEMINSICSLQLEPLLQIALCRIGGASTYMIISCYSIIAEMWKISLWVQELFSLLHAECDGENVANWKYILTTSLEAISPSEREDWSKEQHSGNGDWYNEELTTAFDDSTDNYKILTEKPGGRQLIFVHTGNTGSDAYLALANGLKDCCSFAVLDQWNLYHRDDIKNGIPEIARKYIGVLREHQPHGPYYLGGWCYGGLIAYEMACQLKEMGEQVEELFMFDVHVVRKQVFKNMFIKQSGDAMRRYFEHSPLFESLIKRGLIDALVANSLQVNFDMVQYQPKAYDGEVIYFKAITPASGLKGRAAEYFEEMNSKRAGGFEKYIRQHKLHIVDIKQEHDNLMNEASLSIEIPYMKQYL